MNYRLECVEQLYRKDGITCAMIAASVRCYFLGGEEKILFLRWIKDHRAEFEAATGWRLGRVKRLPKDHKGGCPICGKPKDPLIPACMDHYIQYQGESGELVSLEELEALEEMEVPV